MLEIVLRQFGRGPRVELASATASRHLTRKKRSAFLGRYNRTVERVACGRRLRAAGVGLEDWQDILGHKSGRITTHRHYELGSWLKLACKFNNLPRGARCDSHHEAQLSTTDSLRAPAEIGVMSVPTS